MAIAFCVFCDEAAMDAALASTDTDRVMAEFKEVITTEPTHSRAGPL